MGNIREAVDASIEARGDALGESCAATIAMLRKMADTIDESHGDPSVFKAVTPASFLSYCTALGLTPPEQIAQPAEQSTTTPKSKLDSARGDRYKRFHVA